MLKKIFVWTLLLSFGNIFTLYADMEKSLYDVRGKRDPFAQLISMTASRQSLGLLGVEHIDDIVIEGIVYDPKGSIVMLNGSTLKEGEEVASVKVVSVSPNGAVISVNGMEKFKSLDEQKEGK